MSTLLGFVEIDCRLGHRHQLRMHVLDRLLLAVTTLLACFGVLVAVDLAGAINADACPAMDCYPWGAEGPYAGSLRYGSKAGYIASSALYLIAVFGTLCYLAQRFRHSLRLANWQRAVASVALLISAIVVNI